MPDKTFEDFQRLRLKYKIKQAQENAAGDSGKKVEQPKANPQEK